MKAEFDAFSESYDETIRKSIGFAGRSHDFYTEAKARWILALLREHLGDPSQLSVLDVGCGVGHTDQFVHFQIGQLSGIDLSERSIERARSLNPTVSYASYDGSRMPFADGTFDAAFIICVLHHVPPADRPALMREIARVLKPGGLLMIFEHNPLHPLTRLSVARCELDRDAILLSARTSRCLLREAQFDLVASEYLLYLPFHTPTTNRFRTLRRWLPFGAQYVAAGRSAPAR